MQEIKREVTTKQVIYEVTKEELESIKREYRNKGRNDVVNYIRFSIKNYHYKMNLYGAVEFIQELMDFLNDKTNLIENIYGYSFFDYIKKNK